MILGALGFYEEFADWYRQAGVRFIKICATMPAKPWGEEYGEAYELKVRSRGMEPFVDIRLPDGLLREPEAAEEYGHYCRLVAESRPACNRFVLHEEPNCPVTSAGLGSACYTDILKAGYTAIKSARPETHVYHGGLGIHGDTWTLRQLANSGGLCYTDGVNLHPFIFGARGEGLVERMESLLEDARAYGLPVVITEWGIPSGEHGRRLPSRIYRAGVPVHTETEQAQDMASCLRLFDSTGVDILFLFVQDEDYAAHWAQRCGLFHWDGTPKLSCRVVNEVLSEWKPGPASARH